MPKDPFVVTATPEFCLASSPEFWQGGQDSGTLVMLASARCKLLGDQPALRCLAEVGLCGHWFWLGMLLSAGASVTTVLYSQTAKLLSECIMFG